MARSSPLQNSPGVPGLPPSGDASGRLPSAVDEVDRQGQVLLNLTTVSDALAAASRAVRSYLDAAVKGSGSRPAWFVLLSNLAASPLPTLRELSRQCGLRPPTASRHIARLEQAGFVERQPDLNDGRVTRLSCTPAGELHLEELTRVVENSERALLESAGVQTSNTVQALLRLELAARTRTTTGRSTRSATSTSTSGGSG